MNSGHEKILPQNIEMEQMLLGILMMADNACVKVMGLVEPNDFYVKANEIIFHQISELYKGNRSTDAVSVINELKDRGQLAEVGGETYFVELTDVIPFAGQAKHYAKVIRDKAILRRLIKGCMTVAEECYSGGSTAEEHLAKAEKIIFDVSGSIAKDGVQPLKEIMPSAYDKIVKIAEQGRAITGVPTGLSDLDKITSGFQGSDMITLAARPGMGKTSLAVNMAVHAAQRGFPAAIFTMEMSPEQLAFKMLSSEARVNSMDIRNGRIQKGDWPKLARAVGQLQALPIFIDGTPALSPTTFRAKARRLKAKHGIKLIVIDYIQLMDDPSMRDNRNLVVGRIADSIKAVAKDLDIPILVLSQLNRNLEARADKRPLLSDVKESGTIEQVSDLMIFIYRGEYYDSSPDNPEKGIAEVIVAKHRNGPTGTVETVFDSEYTQFSDLSRLREETVGR